MHQKTLAMIKCGFSNYSKNITCVARPDQEGVTHKLYWVEDANSIRIYQRQSYKRGCSSYEICYFSLKYWNAKNLIIVHFIHATKHAIFITILYFCIRMILFRERVCYFNAVGLAQTCVFS